MRNLSLVKAATVADGDGPSRQKHFVEPSSRVFIRPVLVTGRFFLVKSVERKERPLESSASNAPLYRFVLGFKSGSSTLLELARAGRSVGEVGWTWCGAANHYRPEGIQIKALSVVLKKRLGRVV